MLTSVREWLKQKLAPESFQNIRLYWWYGRLYLPHTVGSVFIRRTPKVRGFSANPGSNSLVEQINRINAFAPTKMCRVMTRYGSDKGRFWHNYTTIYSRLFGKLRDQQLSIFELGLGTDNPALVSTMGTLGRPGASLRGWRELFPKARIYGADIDRDILFEDERIKTFYCDQLDSASIDQLWSQPALKDGMDILIEDGLHTFEGNISFLNGSLERLRPGGVYIIEDIERATVERWHAELQTVYAKRFPDYEFAFVELPNPFNRDDNNLLIVRRKQ